MLIIRFINIKNMTCYSVFMYALDIRFFLEETAYRHRRFVTQSLCSYNLLIKYFASVLA